MQRMEKVKFLFEVIKDLRLEYEIFKDEGCVFSEEEFLANRIFQELEKKGII